jgi:hypothetical protein
MWDLPTEKKAGNLFYVCIWNTVPQCISFIGFPQNLNVEILLDLRHSCILQKMRQ